MPQVQFTDPETIYYKTIKEICLNLRNMHSDFRAFVDRGYENCSVDMKAMLQELIDEEIITGAQKNAFILIVRYILAYGLDVNISKIPANPWDVE